jgi:predicted permease
MLDNFLICLQAVVPMFILLAIGVLIRRSRIIDDASLKKCNRMVFLACFPTIIFENLYGAKFGDAWNTKLVLFALVVLALIIAFTIPLVMQVEKEPASRGAMIQAIYRSNFVIMGLPIVANIYGKGNLAMTAMLIAIIVPTYNVLAVVVLETFRQGRVDVRHMVKRVVTNPLILGGVVGVVFVITQWKLPQPVENVVGDLSSTATTMSLLILGASFSVHSLKRNWRNLVICVLGRLVVMPGLFLPAAVLAGFRDMAFLSLLAMLASPAAISSYTMAVSMDSDGELAGNCVIFTSAASCGTLVMWLFVFKSMNIF